MNANTLRLAHRINDTLAAFLGLIVNFVLIYLIMKSKTKSFRKVFFQIAVIDIIFLVFGAISEPIVVFIEGSEIILQNGIFRHIPQPFNGYLVSAWVFGMYFSISSISIQFLYRYLIICQKMEPTGLKFLGLLMIPLTFGFISTALVQFGYHGEPEDDVFATRVLKDILLESGETSVYASRVGRKGSSGLIIVAAYIMIDILINYSIILYCIIKVQTTLKAAHSTMSRETRQLQNQLTWTFGLQAFVPILVSFGPLACLSYTIYVEGTAFWSMIWLTTGFAWVPFTNALMTLLIVGEFRHKLFRTARSKRITTTTVHSISAYSSILA